eukprot:gene107-750_t
MMEKDAVVQIFLKHLGGDVDEDTIDYISEMVVEDDCKSPSALWEIVGDFLMDGGVVDDENSGQDFCKKTLLPALRPGDNDADNANGYPRDDSPSKAMGELKLKSAVVMGEANGPKDDNGPGFFDPCLGLKGMKYTNDNAVSLQTSIKMNKDKQKDQDRAKRRMQEWQRHRKKAPPPRLNHNRVKSTDVILQNFGVSVAGKELLVDAEMKLVNGRKYGLIGRNGIGKSTLLGAFARRDIPGMPKGLGIASVEQEIDHLTIAKSALDMVLEVDGERIELLEEMKGIEERDANKTAKPEDSDRALVITDRLMEIDSDGAPSRAKQILAGLGFSENRMAAKMNQLSGGWRMRVALSRALFAEPDILILDEPTNHLDLHAVAWLTTYLADWPSTIVVVSHARDFLNDVCTDIMLFRDQKLKTYKGDYDVYEKVREEELKQRQREVDAQERKVAHTQKFIDRFRFNAKRAKMVQSRIKALAKLPMLEELTQDPTLHFQFDNVEPLPTPICQLNEISFKYPKQQGADKNFHLKNVDLAIDLESRIAVCGANGCGKSTLLKLIVGDLEPTEGIIQRHNRLRIGYFSQHHIDSLDLTLTATQSLIEAFPERDLTEEQSRNFLGKFGITQGLSTEPLFVLSGGQKSRVALAHVAFLKPQIMVLDEPSNHLDLDAVQCLIAAITEFKGGVLIVSHDAHLLQCTCDEVWHVKRGEVEKFSGNIDEFKDVLLKENKKALEEAQRN